MIVATAVAFEVAAAAVRPNFVCYRNLASTVLVDFVVAVVFVDRFHFEWTVAVDAVDAVADHYYWSRRHFALTSLLNYDSGLEHWPVAKEYY